MNEEGEEEIRWAKVVESDQVYSAKTGKWFTIAEVRRDRAGQVVARAEGVAKQWPPLDPEKLVMVRRGPTGKAVDVIEIIFSGEM